LKVKYGKKRKVKFENRATIAKSKSKSATIRRGDRD
jgi:hypothetical protein